MPQSNSLPNSTFIPGPYPRGTILHGKNPLKGNLWIIVRDNTFDAALLWNGTAKAISPVGALMDTMTPGMITATILECEAVMGTDWLNRAPAWVHHVLMTSQPCSVLPVAAQIQVNKALGIEEKKVDIAPTSSYDRCIHNYKTYTGFIEVYEYCTKCDVKRRIEK